VAAVLNMGNIKFGEDDNEYSFIKDKTGPLATVAVSIDYIHSLQHWWALLGTYGN